MEDFFDRLDKYMEYSKLNDNKLTVKAKLPVGSLGKQRRGGRGLSVDSIAKILHSAPDLNAEWLLTGDGNMLNQEIGLMEIPYREMSMRMLLERIEMLIRENERLKIQLEAVKKQ